MNISAAGYGAGTYELPGQANVLRVLVGETSGAAEATTVSVIEANIDDLSPQVLGYAMEQLIEAGALDVSFSPLVMKKCRPGTLVRVVARPEDRERLEQVLFRETSTLGLRVHDAERRVQARSFVDVETRTGASGSKSPGTGRMLRSTKIAESLPVKRVCR